MWNIEIFLMVNITYTLNTLSNSPTGALTLSIIEPKNYKFREFFTIYFYHFRMAVPSLKLNSGKDMPQLGFGTWLAAPGVVQTSVQTAIKCGFRHIDCAWIYGNEPEVGAAFKNAFSTVCIFIYYIG